MSDSEPPRRKTLSLKSGVKAPGGPPPLERLPPRQGGRVVIPEASPPPPPPAPAPTGDFKCKPCGTRFDPPAELADDESVRCPSCNARLGLAGDFRADPPRLEKLRARYLKK
ncbi:MAG: zinc ribbon domain-containing protein [Caulobacter sp.]|nr:zinc ribbon domain-containing protein [Caulobacter sp.]